MARASKRSASNTPHIAVPGWVDSGEEVGGAGSGRAYNAPLQPGMDVVEADEGLDSLSSAYNEL
jgi:hypothetical protein